MSAVKGATAWCTLVGSVVFSVAVFAFGVRGLHQACQEGFLCFDFEQKIVECLLCECLLVSTL